MAVQIEYPDGTRQWIPGHLYAGHDGFTVSTHHDTRKAVCRDFGPDHKIISLTLDGNVIEWRRCRPSSSIAPFLNWAIYCEDEAA